ncbi:cytosolic sulfotransferase 18-like [Lolium rigidum]|uniref:cytosolic sulfotransferase 18-like n=1 Tax=Lolium rigidum TaxID=89674 RepID=UPI001F5C4E5F|nr:cytosolic sulfotransferase 18-like [Lolium rigidum]
MAHAQQSPTKSSSEGDLPKESQLKHFMSTLPAREGWSQPLIQYKKYWFRPQMLEKILLVQETYKPRADDIILATQPKCGTTWLKALAFTITNRSRYSFANHPLLTRHPHDVVPFIEISGLSTDHADIETLPSPRLLATHMPMSMLPPDTTSSRGRRIVYLCRDPKDTLVSRLHYENRVVKGCNLSMENAFSMFCEGFSPYGPFWDHCLEYWKESLARPNNVLFLKYEEIMSDPVQAVRTLAKFLGVPLTEEEESSGVAEEVARLCSFETLTGLQVNQVGGVDRGNKVYLDNSVFFRKGKVGDWTNHMSQEMAEKLDRIVQEKLQGCGLMF